MSWKQDRYLSVAPGWCAPSETLYGNWPERDAYALPCWMCGELVEVEQIRIFNMAGDPIINEPTGFCIPCQAPINPPTPDELRNKVEKMLEAHGPLGWWYWLER